jgi:hypothetical protein
MVPSLPLMTWGLLGLTGGSMPTKKIFDTIVVTWVLLEIAWGIPMLWAHKKSMEKNAGNVSKVLAGAVEAVH